MVDSGATRPNGDPAPVIGVTTYRQRAQTGVWDTEAAFLPAQYLDGVTAAGGIAVLLPPQPVTSVGAERVLSRLDGLLISGGVDVDPARYGQRPHEQTDAPQPLRDDWDLALLDAAIAAGLPFLAVCRGAQVLNVLRGGTLVQHLPDVVGSTTYQPGGGQFNRVEVEVEPGSRLASLVGERTLGHVYHHQAIDRVGDGLTVTARSGDGVIEAVELPEHDFGVAVQWHPEEDRDDRALFTGLVDAAAVYAENRMRQDA
ncbi:gamma-glutamyl-gamma-aminobutyrate hydrolase family protein [Gryllotalpicola ginsengisoli]|uniref:gamma-glutamyl-gamma-aminobutyrate hydrolase family protein n=1 Tax=Gryllotalpicola ginsengisoli TaxID=444608 RepID=UPI0003B622D7|nr:gamma-glutamyl-gamma-aminobutyrate hydrolase family protein [Gryllotalpicola ginsengisoli]